MRLGILADIHEDLVHLRAALERFHQERVDRVVVLGDVFCTGQWLGPTVELLRSAEAVGVWGNHDFGLCRDPSPKARQKYPGTVLDFLARLGPRLEIGECLFTHVEPWLDPNDVTQLWWFEGMPDTPAKLARSFDAWPHRVLFMGHVHRWLLASPAGLLPWDLSQPVALAAPP